jgi:hypothetical protein
MALRSAQGSRFADLIIASQKKPGHCCPAGRDVRERFLLFLPALDQFVVVDGQGLFLLVLVLDLERSEVAALDGIRIPVGQIVLFGELRTDIAPDTA